MIYYSYRFRLYPTKEQEVRLDKCFGCDRFVYNYFLDRRNRLYKENKRGSTYYKDCLELTKIKNKEEFIWLKDTDTASLQRSLKNLDSAFNGFFKKRSRFPKFHSKRNSRKSFCAPRQVKAKNGLQCNKEH